MIKELLYKEFKLSSHPTNYIFLLFGAMLLIPSYIYFVPLVYIALTVFFIFLGDEQNNAPRFTSVMPVSKADIVTARCTFVAVIELAHIIVSIPFAILGHCINPLGGNAAGMDANVAFYGCMLFSLGVFNLVFLPKYYKTGYKPGLALIFGSSAMLIVIIVCETLSHIPAVSKYWDSTSPEMLIKQIPVLAAGIAVFVVSTFAACKISINRFEKVDL